MTAILNHDARLSVSTNGTLDAEADNRPLSRTAWPWAGLVAGVAGAVATWCSTPGADEGAERRRRRRGVPDARQPHGRCASAPASASSPPTPSWCSRSASPATWPDDTRGSQLPVVKLAMTAGVGTLIVGFGLKAAAAGGMIGRHRPGLLHEDRHAVISNIAGQMQWVGWQGVAIAMAATAIGAFKYGAFARWVGVVGAIFSVFVAAFTLSCACRTRPASSARRSWCCCRSRCSPRRSTGRSRRTRRRTGPHPRDAPVPRHRSIAVFDAANVGATGAAQCEPAINWDDRGGQPSVTWS